MKLVEGLREIAKKRNITPAQLCLAWVSSLGAHVVPIPGSSYVSFPSLLPYPGHLMHDVGRHAQRTLENIAAASIALDEQDLKEINNAIELNPVVGDRYPKQYQAHLWG